MPDTTENAAEIMTLEQVLVIMAEQGREVLAVSGSSAIVMRRDFDARNGAPIFMLDQITPKSIAYKLDRDGRYPGTNEHSWATDSPAHAIVFRNRVDYESLTEGEWRAEIQSGRRIEVSAGRKQDIAQLIDELNLAQAIVAFAAAEAEKLQGHDGTLTIEQKAHLYDQQRLAADRERKAAEARIVVYSGRDRGRIAQL